MFFGNSVCVSIAYSYLCRRTRKHAKKKVLPYIFHNFTHLTSGNSALIGLKLANMLGLFEDLY